MKTSPKARIKRQFHRTYEHQKKRMQQCRDRARLEDISELLGTFERASIDYKVIFDDYDDLTINTPRNWIQHNYTFQSWGKINSQPLKNSYVINNVYYENWVELFNQIIQQEFLEPQLVYIVWGSQPLLKVQLFDIIEYMPVIFRQYWCTWIVSPEEGWCIERNKERDISFLPIN